MNKRNARKRGSQNKKWLEMAQNDTLHAVLVVSEFKLWKQLPDLEKKKRNITYFIAKCDTHYCDEEAEKELKLA